VPGAITADERRRTQPADGARKCRPRLRDPDHRPPARIRKIQRHDQTARRRRLRLLRGLASAHERQLCCARRLERRHPGDVLLSIAFKAGAQPLG
jgi:hypothetical protein